MATGLIPYLETAKKVASRSIKRNSPSILTGLGVAGLVSTVILAVSATPKAIALIDDAQCQEDEFLRSEGLPSENLNYTTKVKVAWKPYIPTVIMGSVTILCIVSSNSINLKRTAAVAGLYSLTETALKEYKEKVVATIGKNKEEKIQSEIAQDKLNNDPVAGKTILLTGKGEMLCYDVLSGRYFKNDIEQLRRVQNNFNHQLLTEMFVTLNELYSEMGLPGIDLGKSTGWSANGGLLDFKFSAKLTPDGQPCIVVDHNMSPGFDDY